MAYNTKSRNSKNPLPKVAVKDIPEKKRQQLLNKDISKVKEKDFEEWLAVKIDSEFGDGASLIKATVANKLRVEKVKRFATYWREEYSCDHKSYSPAYSYYYKPLDRKLVHLAKTDPHYHHSYLYALEQQKLICMDKYFAHSGDADGKGGYGGSFWLQTRITLFDYLTEEEEVSPDQVRHMNIRNLHHVAHKEFIDEFKNSEYNQGKGYCSKTIDGQYLYRLKMERLYHLIRIRYTRYWWI